MNIKLILVALYMLNWKAIGICAIINAFLTILLVLAFFPFFFLGPLIGGFLTAYLNNGYENYDKIDEKDGIVGGALSGIIGGIIIGLLFLLGFGAISAIIGLIFIKIGIIAGAITLIVGLVITVLSIFLGAVLGAIGGFIGVVVKQNEY